MESLSLLGPDEPQAGGPPRIPDNDQKINGKSFPRGAAGARSMESLVVKPIILGST